MYVRMKFKVKYTFEDRRTPWPTRLRETSPQENRRCWRCHTRIIRFASFAPLGSSRHRACICTHAVDISGREKTFAHLWMTSPSKIRPLLAAAPPSKTFATCNSWKSGGAGVKTTPMPACGGAESFSVTPPCVPWTVLTKSLPVGAAPAPRTSGEVEVRGAADSGGVGTGVAPESVLSPRTSLTSGCEVKDSAAGSPPTGEPKGEAIL